MHSAELHGSRGNPDAGAHAPGRGPGRRGEPARGEPARAADVRRREEGAAPAGPAARRGTVWGRRARGQGAGGDRG